MRDDVQEEEEAMSFGATTGDGTRHYIGYIRYTDDIGS